MGPPSRKRWRRREGWSTTSKLLQGMAQFLEGARINGGTVCATCVVSFRSHYSS
jgi:hypothetical protein